MPPKNEKSKTQDESLIDILFDALNKTWDLFFDEMKRLENERGILIPLEEKNEIFKQKYQKIIDTIFNLIDDQTID